MEKSWREIISLHQNIGKFLENGKRKIPSPALTSPPPHHHHRPEKRGLRLPNTGEVQKRKKK
jgi:hypothetical protein